MSLHLIGMTKMATGDLFKSIADVGFFLFRVQKCSQFNKMSAHNLAVILVPTLFQSMNQDLLRLTREFIIHHTLLFLVHVPSQTNVPVDSVHALNSLNLNVCP